MSEKIKELIKLVEENPGLPVYPAVHYEVVCEDWGRWLGSIKEVKKELIYFMDEKWKAGDEDDILDAIEDEICDYPEHENLTDNEFSERVKRHFEFLKENNKIQEAIIISIDTF